MSRTSLFAGKTLPWVGTENTFELRCPARRPQKRRRSISRHNGKHRHRSRQPIAERLRYRRRPSRVASECQCTSLPRSQCRPEKKCACCPCSSPCRLRLLGYESNDGPDGHVRHWPDQQRKFQILLLFLDARRLT